MRGLLLPVFAGTKASSKNLGGAKEGRTPDLLNAIQTLYQLSYSPMCRGRGGNLANSPPEVKQKMRKNFLFFRVDPEETPVIPFAPVETPVRAHGPYTPGSAFRRIRRSNTKPKEIRP